MLLFSASLLLVLEFVSATNEDCTHFYEYPMNCYLQESGDIGDLSRGLECVLEDINGTTDWYVIESFYSSTDCRGDPYFTWSYLCDLW